MDDFTSQAKYETRKVSELIGWDNNPRTYSRKDLERLQEQIRRLGVYKPLLINQNNIVLGGNMRLEALKDLAVDEVMCSVVLTDNTAQMLEYALSDNDHTGTTDDQKVAELVSINPIKTEIFSVAPVRMKPLQKVVDSFGPESSQGNQSPTEAGQRCRQCPLHCGMENI